MADPWEFPAKVPRPRYSVLENAALKARGLNCFRPWQEGTSPLSLASASDQRSRYKLLADSPQASPARHSVTLTGQVCHHSLYEEKINMKVSVIGAGYVGLTTAPASRRSGTTCSAVKAIRKS